MYSRGSNPRGTAKSTTMEFEQYYDEVCLGLSSKGYQRAPDRDVVQEDFVNGHTVDECIQGFEEDWGDPGDEEID